MTEDKSRDPDSEDSFAELLEAYSEPLKSAVRIGDKIEGAIIAIGKDAVFVDSGTKIDAVVDREDLLDDSGELPYAVGDTLSLYVVSQSESEIRLSRAMSGIGGRRMLQEAHENDIPVEGKVKAVIKGGFEIQLLQQRAFCPISQIDAVYVEDPQAFVGQTFDFAITRFEENGRNIVVSRRRLLEKIIAEKRRDFLEKLRVGDVVGGKVVKLMPYGAFVTLAPGVEGMAHISELSWSSVSRTEDVLSVGDAVDVKVLDIKDDVKSGRKKIELSIKQTTGDPWQRVNELLSQGAVVNGTVIRCAPFGVFVEVAPGIEGLVHISEMSYTRRVVNPADEVREGEVVPVMIKEIDAAGKRVALSMKDAAGDPWLDVATAFHVGQKIEGRLENKAPYGYFISLKPGVTGLLPNSKIKAAGRAAMLDGLREGDVLPVVIEAINAGERKMTLAPGDAAEESGWQRYAGDASQPSTMGDLGEKLKQALQRKKDGT